MTKEAHPFVKWAGGKSQLLDRLIAVLPSQVSTYYEPFTGGGAMFFALAAQKRFQRAVLNDCNRELINTYQVIRDAPADLIAALQKLRSEYATDPKGIFLRERAKDPQELIPTSRAARFIFLNRTGFNGLYRVNKSGQFNVPFGRYDNPRILDEDNIRACSEVLGRSVEILSEDFSAIVSEAKAGDLVYFDPPYVPLSTTANFASYTSGGFTINDQYRLALCFKELVQRGVMVVASNSDTATVHELYEGFELLPVAARRNINSKGNLRGPVGELIIVGRRPTTLPSPSLAPVPLQTDPASVPKFVSQESISSSLEVSSKSSP